MTPEVQPRVRHSQLSPARARLCALISQMTEQQVEALLRVLELLQELPRAQVATDAPVQQESTADAQSPTGGRPTYTVAEAARLLGVKETTLRERIRVGRVSVVRVAHRVLVRSEELEHLLAASSAAKEHGNGQRR